MIASSRFLKSFHTPFEDTPAFWFMRQAGRYLPEYQQVRKAQGGFLELCYSPQHAAEVTLQPITRFGMDAAIIFSDILVVPHAMGMEVGFVAGEGPKLDPVSNREAIGRLKEEVTSFLSPVYEAIRLTKKQLPPPVCLIGFSGAPWTLACYMLEGRGGGEFSKAREFLYRENDAFFSLMDRLVETVSQHLIAQVAAGAEALQIFDSWAGLVPSAYQEACVFEPTKRIVQNVKASFPHIPMIGFPRGLGMRLGEYVEATGVDGISVDTSTPLSVALSHVPKSCVIQGNLDPLLLATDRQGTLNQAEAMVRQMQGRKYIFNLGHGILQQTPPEHVAALSQYLKGEAKRACA